MINGKKLFFSFLLWLLIIFKISSQGFAKGQIYSHKGDTADGFIMMNNEPAYICYFKPSLRDKAIPIGAKEIKGLQSAGQVYYSTKVRLNNRDTLLFVRQFFNGDFGLRHFELMGTKYFIVVRPDSSLFMIKFPDDLNADEIFSGLSSKTKFKNHADSIFPDAPYLREYRKGVKPELNSMLALLNQYHNIPPGSSVREFIPGIVAGTRFENYKANIENDGYKGYSSPSPFIGFTLKIHQKEKIAGFLVRNTLGYHIENYSYKKKYGDIIAYNQTTIKTLSDNFEAGFTLKPLKATNIIPLFEVGGTARYYFNADYENYSEEVYLDRIVISSLNHDVLNSSFFYGGFSRIGISKILKTGDSVSILAGYSYLLASGKEKIHSAEFSVIYNFLKK